MEQPTMVLVPFGTNLLAMSAEQFQEALERGRTLAPSSAQPETMKTEDNRIVDADGAASETGVPATWFLEQARRNTIPHLKFGKYVRFRLSAVLEAVTTSRRR